MFGQRENHKLARCARGSAATVFFIFLQPRLKRGVDLANKVSQQLRAVLQAERFPFVVFK